jgi:hypothetical protein
MEGGLERLRSASKDLVGNKYRLEIAGVIHALAGATFSAMAVSSETGIFYARVHEELQRLAQIGMIRSVEGGPSSGVVEYKATASVYWEFCSALRDEVSSANPNRG